MPCYSPMRAWYSNTVSKKTGKRQITFNRNKALVDMEISLPCGRCIGCRFSKSIQWALRCVHEASLHDKNCFITLTYDDDYVPQNGSLVKKHFQDFMKRLRNRIHPEKCRYYMCGEYGSELGRPHYHALLFGYDFPDKELFKYRPKSILYTSKLLQDLWPFGYVTVGALTYETAAYTAKYATKKVFGDAAAAYYGDRIPEYSQMSLKPGIGQGFFEKHKKELFRHDNVVNNGRKFPLPRYYTAKFSMEEQAKLKAHRRKLLSLQKWNNSLERLRVREKVKLAHLKVNGYGTVTTG